MKLLALCLALAAFPAFAQKAPEPDPDAVVIDTLRNPVAKSYNRIVSGMDHFEKNRHLAPQAELRFRLLPRRRDTKMSDIDVAIVGKSVLKPVPVAADGTFTLERDAKALAEGAEVQPNRKKMTMTWRADIRSPGVPPGMRRLGDLRLECEVGMKSGLVSNVRAGLFGFRLGPLEDGPEYCYRDNPRYLFFADRPLWSVALVHGDRRYEVPVDRLYAGASRDPEWKDDLKYCDCEVLVDRAYFLPLGDRSWPDDTLVQFRYMDDPA